MNELFLFLVTITIINDALLAGAALDYTIKQLPARKMIGMVAYRKYFIASDLGRGRLWYIPLGLAAYFLTVAAAVGGYLQGLAISIMIPFYLAAICALVHAFATSQAIPASMQFLKVKEIDDEAILNKSFDRFARWVIVRGIVGVPMFVAILLGLIMIG